MSSPIYVGIAGWSYADWKGIVYTSSKIDQLEYVSGFVDCLEINSTFYRPPVEKNSKSTSRASASGLAVKPSSARTQTLTLFSCRQL